MAFGRSRSEDRFALSGLEINIGERSNPIKILYGISGLAYHPRDGFENPGGELNA